MDRDEFFGGLFDEKGDYETEIRAVRQLAFEERVIKRVFTGCGYKPGSWGRLANQCRAVTGENKLNFNWFNSEYRSFPGHLCGKRIPYLHQLNVLDLFKMNQHNRIVKTLLRALNKLDIADNPLDARFLFAFPIKRTLFCAHNISKYLNVEDDNQLLASLQFQIDKRELTIAPAKTVFMGLGTAWIPKP